MDGNGINSKRNILLVGLIYDLNLGDLAIYESCLKITKDCLNSLAASNVEIKALDLYARETSENNCKQKPKIVIKLRNIIMPSKTKTTEELEMGICVKLQDLCSKIIDENTIGILFVGGGLIKFSSQIIAKPMVTILNYAQDRHIPVMLSAVGIEGYDNSVSCQELKKALNYHCVKMITTRDNIELLQKCYVENRDIISKKVADPACSIKQLYPLSHKGYKSIGLGVVRGSLFSDYGVDFNENQALDLWSELYCEVIKRGYNCQLFSNGLPADQAFAEKVVKQLNKHGIKANVLPRPKNIRQLVDIISLFDGIVVARLHASILAYAYDIPFIGLVWNEKQWMFGQSIGGKDRFLRCQDFSASYILDKLEETKQNPYYVKKEDYINSTKQSIMQFLKNIL